MTNYPDPGERMARVREMFAREQAKMPSVDHNGYPLPPAPETITARPDDALTARLAEQQGALRQTQVALAVSRTAAATGASG